MKMYSTRDRREKPLLPKGIGPLPYMLPTFMLDCCFAADRADNGETASLKRVKRGGPCTKKEKLRSRTSRRTAPSPAHGPQTAP